MVNAGLFKDLAFGSLAGANASTLAWMLAGAAAGLLLPLLAEVRS